MFPSSTHYPPQALEGDLLTFDRPHSAADHEPELEWEAKLGGAIGRCKVCGEPVAMNVEVLGPTVPPLQLAWVLNAVREVNSPATFFLH